VRIAKEIGATPAQVALSWIADRPGVVAPIVGARTVDHLKSNLGAADLALSAEATSELDKISAPQPGGYPYGAFGAWQRGRAMQDGMEAPPPPFAAGSTRPTWHT
jgi:diketogulonate reductase-like aldo/keto reductase